MRELPQPPVLVNWHGSPYVGGLEHAFTDPFWSLCNRLRWSARLAATNPAEPKCGDCVRLVREAVRNTLAGIPLHEDTRELVKGGLRTD